MEAAMPEVGMASVVAAAGNFVAVVVRLGVVMSAVKVLEVQVVFVSLVEVELV